MGGIKRETRFGLSESGVDSLGESCVYVVHGVGTDFWKIGLTGNVLQRLVTLEDNLPFRVEVCVLIGGRINPKRVESRFLSEVSTWRCRGEWFDVREVEHPAFFRQLDLVMPGGFEHKARDIVIVEGPAYRFMDAALKIVEDMGRSTYRWQPAPQRPRFDWLNGAELMDLHLVEDRLDYAKWHVCNRVGRCTEMEFS